MQTTEKRTIYTVNELFRSFQGEGCHAGRDAVFVRLQGCDQRCSWCDSASTWQPDKRPEKLAHMTDFEILEYVEGVGLPKQAPVIITGGEPTLYDLTQLGHTLTMNGYRVHLETAGHHPVVWPIHWVTVSPKTHPGAMRPLLETVHRADEFKIIVADPARDISAGLNAIEGRSRDVPVWFHPEWSQMNNATVLEAIANVVGTEPCFRAGLQIHKFYQVR